MRLDVIIPTYNRCDLLRRTLESLRVARIPLSLDVRVTVVDNNSKDATRQTVESFQKYFDGRLDYLLETRQGRSSAINAGIVATKGELVGFIDDDEEVDANWCVRIASAFAESEVDFIGGPCLPRWGAERPAWLPDGYRGVIGWVEGGTEIVAYDENYEGILMGGNAVLTRAILDRVGHYSTALGRTDKGLLSCEDEDMYQRLRAAGARGLYLPDLIIYHYVPPERMTKRYYRRWCFWRGVSSGFLDRTRPAPVAYLAGVPRYLYGSAARGFIEIGNRLFTRSGTPARSFSNELAFWDLAGFFYGKHVYKAADESHASIQPSTTTTPRADAS